MIRTNNPAFSASNFGPGAVDFSPVSVDSAIPGAMTLQGAVNKTFILLALCAAAAVFAWSKIIPSSAVVGGAIAPGSVGNPTPWMIGGFIGGMILTVVMCASPKRAPIFAPIYALVEGLFLGSVSAVYAVYAGGKEVAGGLTLDYSLIMQAGLLTFAILAAMLIAYSARIIKPTQRFKRGIIAATGGIALLIVSTWILGAFGVQIPYIYSTGPIGIGFALLVIGIASMNLVLDFDLIEQGISTGAPKYMEWYAGFGLLLTLVVMYTWILWLLSLLSGRD